MKEKRKRRKGEKTRPQNLRECSAEELQFPANAPNPAQLASSSLKSFAGKTLLRQVLENRKARDKTKAKKVFFTLIPDGLLLPIIAFHRLAFSQPLAEQSCLLSIKTLAFKLYLLRQLLLFFSAAACMLLFAFIGFHEMHRTICAFISRPTLYAPKFR